MQSLAEVLLESDFQCVVAGVADAPPGIQRRILAIEITVQPGVGPVIHSSEIRIWNSRPVEYRKRGRIVTLEAAIDIVYRLRDVGSRAAAAIQ